MSFFLAGAAVVSAGLGVAKAIKGGADKREAKKANEKAKAQMEKDRKAYLNLDTSNPYLNMENTMEDLTVNTQAADFAAEQNQVGMADTMSNMNQAAGGSGVAALAQAMANQGQIANQKASISIADQEKANQVAERNEASKLQMQERKGDNLSRQMKASMANKALQFSSGDVSQTSADINAAQADIDSGINDIFGAAGSIAGGVG
jgi:hypothetical protein